MNRLSEETSPYLLQHANNPVDWFPWGEEAFDIARKQDKPIFLSVGYSACHWCHVMEHESFENEDIAKILNESYISIKVDREERPDVDQIYMTAVQLITKRGGWPMSVFMTPKGEPFYGGTYWPPTSRMGMPGFREILVKLADYWDNKRDEVETSAEQLVTAIQEMAAPVFESADLKEETLQNATRSITQTTDWKHGGFGGAPKFPHPMDIRVLLRGWKRFGDQQALEAATLTLRKMLHGGIYDQLGGGFHRYSTDAYWLVPHFEKMLYDNALLVPAYLEAWQATGEPEFQRAVRETLDYVLREMNSAEGGFFSTQDADSEGEEGKFFVWSKQEIIDTLGDEAGELFCQLYDVSPRGNWEGVNILNRTIDLDKFSSQHEISSEELEQRLASGREKLFDVRRERIAPGRDDKVLVGWNGMMIAAMAKASLVFNEPRYLAAAESAAKFILNNMRTDNGKLLHTYKDGRARFQAYLDDYACLIDGLVELFQASGDESFLVAAIELSEEMIIDFGDSNHGGFFYTATDHEQLIARTKETQDNAVPSGNGMAATALAKLGHLCERQDFTDAARKTLDSFSRLLVEHPRASGQALIALDFLLGPNQEIVLVYPDEKDQLQPQLETTTRQFLPGALFVLYQSGTEMSVVEALTAGKHSAASHPRTYICSHGECRVPAESIEQLQRQLSELES